MIRYYFSVLCLVFSSAVFAQNDSTALVFGSGNTLESTTVISPEIINASDGDYEKYVLIRWEAADKGGQYRLFRATSASGASMRELTKGWQKSTWFCDYSAEKGRDYYYAVMESDGTNSAPLSKFDKGFVRKKTLDVAQEESLTSTTPDKYAAGQVVFMLVGELGLDSTQYAAGSQVPMRIGLQNIFEEAATRTDLRVYLSTDPTWDFNDSLLLAKSYSGFPANFKGVLNEKIGLPPTLLTGSYHLIVVTAPEGNILNAKTGTTIIHIKPR
jgi:hypothetical protein